MDPLATETYESEAVQANALESQEKEKVFLATEELLLGAVGTGSEPLDLSVMHQAQR